MRNKKLLTIGLIILLMGTITTTIAVSDKSKPDERVIRNGTSVINIIEDSVPYEDPKPVVTPIIQPDPEPDLVPETAPKDPQIEEPTVQTVETPKEKTVEEMRAERQISARQSNGMTWGQVSTTQTTVTETIPVQ